MSIIIIRKLQINVTFRIDSGSLPSLLNNPLNVKMKIQSSTKRILNIIFKEEKQ